jgi:hypothetical protein
MRDYSQKTKKFGMYSKETFLPIRMQSTKFLKRQVKKRPNRQELVRDHCFAGVFLGVICCL